MTKFESHCEGCDWVKVLNLILGRLHEKHGVQSEFYIQLSMFIPTEKDYRKF
jgi:hypothetical protein